MFTPGLCFPTRAVVEAAGGARGEHLTFLPKPDERGWSTCHIVHSFIGRGRRAAGAFSSHGREAGVTADEGLVHHRATLT